MSGEMGDCCQAATARTTLRSGSRSAGSEQKTSRSSEKKLACVLWPSAVDSPGDDVAGGVVGSALMGTEEDLGTDDEDLAAAEAEEEEGRGEEDFLTVILTEEVAVAAAGAESESESVE